MTDTTPIAPVTDALKPCPFCKSANLRPPMQDLWEKWFIGCADCGAEGSQADSPAEAIAAWNERQQSASPSGLVEVSKDEIAEMLVKAAAPYGNRGTSGMARWCRANAVNRTHANEFANRKRAPQPDLLAALGIRRVYAITAAPAPADEAPSASGEAGPTPLQAASRIVADFRPEGWPSKRNEIATYLERHFVPRTALQSTPPTDAVREALEREARKADDLAVAVHEHPATVIAEALDSMAHRLRAALSAHPAPVEWLERALDIVNVVEGNIRGSHADQADRLMELWRILYALRPNTESGRTPVAIADEANKVCKTDREQSA